MTELSKNTQVPQCDKTNVISRLSMNDILLYEVHSNWLTSWIGFSWGQEIMGWYIAKKVNRKYKRYLYSLECRKRVFNDL